MIEIEYCYRDAANYKNYGTVKVQTLLAPEEVKEALLPTLHEGEFFIASQVGFDELFFPTLSTDDHCWHQLLEIQTSEETEADYFFEEILEAFRIAHLNGWQEFDVESREKIAVQPFRSLP